MSEGIVLKNHTGTILDYNNAALDVLGISAEQLNGKTSIDPDWHSTRLDGSSFPDNEDPVILALTTAKPQKNVIIGIETKGSEKHWIIINSVPLFLEDEKKASHSVSTFANITKQVMAQQALVQSAKMTSLGEMAGGVAHEINNPLAIIISATGLILNYLSTQPVEIEKAIKMVKKIETTAQRISQIVKGMRIFSRNSASFGSLSIVPCSILPKASRTSG